MAAVLITDLLILGWLVRFDTRVSAWVTRHVYRDFSGRRGEFVDSIQLVRREGGGFSVIDASQSADELATLSQGAPERVVSVSYWRGAWWVGAWAPWWKREVSTVLVAELADGAEPEPREVSLARRALSDRMRTRERVNFAEEIEAGDYNRRSFVWWGPVHDAVMGLLVVGLLACVPSMPGWWRRRGVKARLARGVCPACLYDISRTPESGGLTRCPECGRAWAADASIPARR